MTRTGCMRRSGRRHLRRTACALLALALALTCSLVPNATAQGAFAEGTADLNVGSPIKYDGWDTRYMNVGGAPAYCAQPAKAAPEERSYAKHPIQPISNTGGFQYDAKYLAAVLWFGSGGPGFDKSMWPATYYGGAPWTGPLYHAMTHVMVADFYACDGGAALTGCSADFCSWVGSHIMMFWGDSYSPTSVEAQIRDRVDEVPQGFRDNCFELHTGADTQVIMSFTPGGWIDLQKASADGEMTKGNALYALEGAEYGIYSKADCSTRVGTLKTDASGYAKSDYLNVGTYYVKETEAPAGYALDDAVYGVAVISGKTVRVNGTAVRDLPQSDPAQMWVAKVDSATGMSAPQGGASLEGAQFTVRYYRELYDTAAAAEASGAPARTWVVATDKNGRALLSESERVSGDELYHDSQGRPAIPLGTILVQETKAPAGYFLTDSTVYVRKVAASGQTESVHVYNAPTVKEQVYRGDIEFVKARESDQSRLGRIPFRITSQTTGESHVIVTDENGEAKTASSWNAHTRATNGNDAAVRADSTVDEAALDPAAGVFFYGTADRAHQTAAQIDDGKGALPYDTYLIEELAVPKNAGLALIKIPVTIYKDSYMVDLGTIDNQSEGEASLFTSARDATTGSKKAYGDHAAELVDRVQYAGLDISGNAAYELRTTLMDASTGDAVRDADGTLVAGSMRFMPTSPHGVVEVRLRFDARPYADRDVVFFEELIRCDTGATVAEHKDLADFEQTVRIAGPSLRTTAADAVDGDGIVSADTAACVIDRVTYRNLVPGAEYRITGSLHVRTVEMNAEGTTITAEPLLDAAGAPVALSRTFTPEYADGTIDVSIPCDINGLAGRSLVVYEMLTREGQPIAEHADPADEGQTVKVESPEISTVAIDTEDADSVVAADRHAALADTVHHANLTPGNEYRIVGTLMVKRFGEDGSIVDAMPLLDATGEEVTGQTVFTPDAPEGTVEVTFDFDAAGLDGQELVVYERLYRDDVLVAEDANPNNIDQSFSVAAMSVKTHLAADDTASQSVTADSEAQLTDTVEYSDAAVGAAYTAYGMLVDPDTGLPLLQYGKERASAREAEAVLGELACALGLADGGEAQGADALWESDVPYPHAVDLDAARAVLEAHPGIASRFAIASQSFTAEGTFGIVKLGYRVDARGLAGTRATACVLIVCDDPCEATAGELDLTSSLQTVELTAPQISTSATDATDGDKSLLISSEATIDDEVSYLGLTPGKEYILQGVLYDRAAERPLLVGDREVRAERYFVPAAADGTETVRFSFDATGIGGRDVVVFEHLYREMETPSGVAERELVAEHADIRSDAQTVSVGGSRLAGTGYDKTGDVLSLIIGAMAALVTAAALAGAYASARKRKGAVGSAKGRVAMDAAASQPGARRIHMPPRDASPFDAWMRENRGKVICGAAMAALCIAICAGFAMTGSRQAAAEEATAALAAQVGGAHVHTWQRDAELVHHDAQTHEVAHDAVYEEVSVPHTVCNACRKAIDGKTEEHAAATGHESYTTGVPIPEQRMTSEAWTETVVDEPAYDELVSETETCSSCGISRACDPQGAGDGA